jgi:hypothetical protein
MKRGKVKKVEKKKGNVNSMELEQIFQIMVDEQNGTLSNMDLFDKACNEFDNLLLNNPEKYFKSLMKCLSTKNMDVKNYLIKGI